MKHFLSVFELKSDSLSAIQVEPHQCLLHQSILLTQGPIHEILAEIAQLLVAVEKLSFFESAILIFFLPHSHENQSKFIGYQGFLPFKLIWAYQQNSSKMYVLRKLIFTVASFVEECHFMICTYYDVLIELVVSEILDPETACNFLTLCPQIVTMHRGLKFWSSMNFVIN